MNGAGGVRETGERQERMLVPSEQRGGSWAQSGGQGHVSEEVLIQMIVVSRCGFQGVAYMQANKEKQFAQEEAARARCLGILFMVIALSFTNYTNLTE